MATANQLPPFALPNTLNLPQPNFDLIEQGAKELGKIRNLPAFAQGQAILDAINQVGAHVDTKFNQLSADADTKVTQLQPCHSITTMSLNHNHVTQSQPCHSIDQPADSLMHSSTSLVHMSIQGSTSSMHVSLSSIHSSLSSIHR